MSSNNNHGQISNQNIPNNNPSIKGQIRASNSNLGNQPIQSNNQILQQQQNQSNNIGNIPNGNYFVLGNEGVTETFKPGNFKKLKQDIMPNYGQKSNIDNNIYVNYNPSVKKDISNNNNNPSIKKNNNSSNLSGKNNNKSNNNIPMDSSIFSQNFIKNSKNSNLSGKNNNKSNNNIPLDSSKFSENFIKDSKKSNQSKNQEIKKDSIKDNKSKNQEIKKEMILNSKDFEKIQNPFYESTQKQNIQNNPNDNKNNNNMLHEFNQNPSNQHKVENQQKNINDMQAQKNKINKDNYNNINQNPPNNNIDQINQNLIPHQNNHINNSNPNEKQLIKAKNFNNNNIPYSFSRYKKASKTGLKNLGNTSYLNSVLQILCYIRSFASYFLNPKNGEEFKNKVSDYKVSYVFHRLCTHIFPYPEKDNIEIYKPDALLKVLSLYNVTYKDYKEKNPNDLIVFILYKLHEELNSLKMYDSSKYISNSTSTMIFNDKDASVKNGIKKFTQVNKSIISNYFTWFEIKESQCLKCSKKIYNLQNFSTFQLNIFDLIKYKKQKYIKIEDCFELYISPKTKNNVCRFCNSYNNIITTTNIYSAPNIFIFLLDYTNYIDNNDFSFVLERKINLGKYIENKNGPTNYILNGIVYWDKNKNKYQAFSASPVDKNWYLCDDENVTSTDVNNFIDIFNKNLCYKPFILVYHYLNN